MTYTVQLDFWMDDDTVGTDEEIAKCLKDILEGTAYGAENIKVLDVND